MAHGFLHAVAMCVKHCALYTRVARCVAFHVIESVLYGALWQGRESLWTERFLFDVGLLPRSIIRSCSLCGEIFSLRFFVAMRCVSDPFEAQRRC